MPIIFGLGIRHGLDLDHLATIDAITRTMKATNRLSKRVGLFFSLGHGFVVILISVIVGSGLIQAQFPVWIEAAGNWISITCLFLFGLLALWNTIRVPAEDGLFITPKSALLTKLIGKHNNPVFIILIGMLFAFSFDTFTQVALFSVTASAMAGWIFSLLLGLLFTAGMMLADGMNGLLIGSLIQRANQNSRLITRVLGLLIACFSIGLGLFSLAKQLT